MKNNKNENLFNTPSPALRIPSLSLTKEMRRSQVGGSSKSIGTLKVAEGQMRKHQKGFTLIELLVVVLIIGILAAVALPQYGKAVERARASEAFILLKSVHQAAQAYKLEHGTYPDSFDELAVNIPWTGSTKFRDMGVMRDTRSNDLWSLQLYKETNWLSAIYLGRISGKYAGAGFLIYDGGGWQCIEKTEEGVVFAGEEGDYCVKIMRTASSHETYENGRYYTFKP